MPILPRTSTDVPIVGGHQHTVAIGQVSQQVVFDADQSVIDAFERYQYAQQCGFSGTQSSI
jgi:hypothetical protein